MNSIKYVVFFVISTAFLWSGSSQFAQYDEPIIITEEEEYMQGEILVGFKPGVGIESAKSIHAQYGTSLISVNKRIGCHRVRISESETIETMLNIYRLDPRVRYAELNYKCYATVVPNDPRYGEQWALPKIQAPDAWDIQTGNSSIILSIIDTGVNYNHEDLTGFKVDTANDTDFVNNDNDAMDDHGHGTHCAGIVSANTNNNTGIAGIIWNCTILPLKVLDNNGSGTYASIMDALVYAADQGVDIISMSLSGSGRSTGLSDAINYAFDHDCLIVAASSNGGVGTLSFPAGYNKVLAVGATDQTDLRASFSQYGPDLDVVAPGVSILSLALNNTEYVSWSGTSMATPYVAGLAGLILSENPSLTNIQVWECIRQTANDVGPAGWDEEYGYGRINAFNAVSAAPVPKEVAMITSPETYCDYFMTGLITIIGIATDNYQIKYGSGFNPTTWTTFASGSGAAGERDIGSLNVSSVPSGIKIIKLELSDGTIDQIAVVIQKEHLTGWPIYALLGRGSSSIVDLDGDGDNELLTGGYNSVYAWHHDGTPVTGWPVASGYTRSAPSVCDIEGDGDYEIFSGVYHYSQSMRAWHHDGTLVTGWPQTAYYTRSEVNIGDIDGDGDLEMLTSGIYFDDVHAFHHDGTPVSGWPYAFADRVYTSLSLADLDGDNDLETVVCPSATPGSVYVFNGDATLFPGWPQPAHPQTITQSCAIGDIDGDGDLEIVGAGFDSIYAWHHDGVNIWRIKPTGGTNVGRCPALCDLDFDGDLEIIVNKGNYINVFYHDGTPFPGFPVPMGDNNRGRFIVISSFSPTSPIVGDLDGDGDLEIISAPTWGYPYPNAIYAFHHNGAPVAGFPKYMQPQGTTWNKLFSVPSLCDLDADGDVEVVIDNAYMEQGFMFVFDESGSYDPVFMDWPTLHHNLWHNGWYHPEPPTNLSAIGGFTWVDLVWSKNKEPDIAGYNIFRSLTTGGPYIKINSGLITDTTYHDAGVPSPQTYYYVVTARIHAENESHYSNEVNATTIGILEEPFSNVITPFLMVQSNNPASVSSGLKITFGIQQNSYVKLQVFDICGRSVATLCDEETTPGIYSFKWNRKDNNNRTIPSGIYFVKLESEEFNKTQKVILLK